MAFVWFRQNCSSMALTTRHKSSGRVPFNWIWTRRLSILFPNGNNLRVSRCNYARDALGLADVLPFKSAQIVNESLGEILKSLTPQLEIVFVEKRRPGRWTRVRRLTNRQIIVRRFYGTVRLRIMAKRNPGSYQPQTAEEGLPRSTPKPYTHFFLSASRCVCVKPGRYPATVAVKV